MSLCPKCKIDILDDAVMCPLCHCVLERDGSEPAPEESVSLMYPDVSLKVKSLKMAKKIAIFSAIVVQAVCILVNYLTYSHVEFRWSLLTGLGLLYGCMSLIISVTRTRSHRRKIVVQLGVWLILLLAVDYSIGFTGWSVAFGFPISILTVLIGVGILMIVKSEIWHSYIYSLIWLVLFALVTLIPAFLIEKVSFVLLDIIAALVTVTFLAGVIVIGDRKAENELKRRFHV